MTIQAHPFVQVSLRQRGQRLFGLVGLTLQAFQRPLVEAERAVATWRAWLCRGRTVVHVGHVHQRSTVWPMGEIDAHGEANATPRMAMIGTRDSIIR